MVRLLALIALIAATLAGPARAQEIPLGSWRLVLAQPGGGLPVGLELSRERGQLVATLVNGSGRIRAEQTTVSGGTLTLAFPSYASSLSAMLAPDGTLVGTARLMRQRGTVDVPFTARRGERHRFFAAVDPKPMRVAGTWAVTWTSPDGTKRAGLGLLRQSGRTVEGTMLFTSGDYRFLAGEVNGPELALSTFDGNQGSVWRATRQADGTLAGTLITPTSTSDPATWSRWTARLDPRAELDDPTRLTVLQPGFDRLSFSFPDVNGQPVSLDDPRFKGRVVIVTIGGTWCPNCHDEAAFLQPYYAKHRRRGLEVVGLQFEYTEDFARSAAQAKRFSERFGITYPLLIAGRVGRETTRAALPAIDGVTTYPTMIIIDRRGVVRRIHTGFSGPATGARYTQFAREFDRFVQGLLAERL
jgi:peroxiredoxin